MTSASLTIDLNALAENWQSIDKLSGSGVETGAVVKADAYGLGAAKVARHLARIGVQKFFVAIAQEGADIRDAVGQEAEIYVFSGHMAGDTDTIGDLGLTPILNSVEQLTRHFEALPGHPFGIQLDTGMNRLGMKPGEWDAVRDIAMAAGPSLIMSHLACADEPDHPMNARQLAQFSQMSDGLTVVRSLAATAGALLGPDYHFDLVRPGVGLFGGMPFADAKPVINLTLPVVQVCDLDVGESVGYAAGWVAKRPSKIATVSAGYADGVLRVLGDKLRLYFEEQACPVVGRISMDLITADITDLGEDPKSLDLICTNQSIDDLAEQAGTIGYEILTALGARYERRYRGQL